MQPTKEYTIGNNDLYVMEFDSMAAAKAIPLLLIHGSWGGGWMWQKYIPVFNERGWNVFTLALRGHARSGGNVEGAGMQDYVTDIETVATELQLHDPIVVGHSIGGLVALMYAAQQHVRALVSIDGSLTAEVQGEGKEVEYPIAYTPQDAGMPQQAQETMKAFSDIPQQTFMQMKHMLQKESGIARSDRKRGISILKEQLHCPLLFVGAELGTSVPFGIGTEKSKKMASHYGGTFIEIKKATHPGILLGEHAKEAATAVARWLEAVA